MQNTPDESPAESLPTLSAAAKRRVAVTAVVLVSLAFGAWGCWRVFAPEPVDARAQIDERDDRLEAQQDVIEELQQRVATLARSDQISRDANRELQGTLAERDEEIAALRADVDFYERFVGATAQRRGLAVHELHLDRRAGEAWHFTATLTQNLNRGVINRGTLVLEIEGTRDGRLQTLDWQDLRQDQEAEGVAYSFRYFQQVEGDFVLPGGFRPVGVTVRLAPTGGSEVAQEFDWQEATAGPSP